MVDAEGADGEEPRAFSVEEAGRVLAEGCRLVGFDPAGAVLMRLGDHAVFRLAGASVVARIGRGAEYAEAAVRDLAVSRWLNARDVPTVRPALAADQPVVVDGRVVVFWQAIGSGEDYASVVQVAELLRRLHALVPPPDLALPPLVPFDRTRRRLIDATALGDGDRVFLLDRVEELDEAYGRLTFALPAGPIHGDANVGNVLLDEAGRPWLIDLDGFAVGPREWDLVQTAMFFDSYGWHTAEEYARFVEVYGFDVMAWDGYPVLRDVRETLMVGWMAQNIGTDDRTAAEFGKRMRALRTGASRRDWAPF